MINDDDDLNPDIDTDSEDERRRRMTKLGTKKERNVMVMVAWWQSRISPKNLYRYSYVT